MPKFLNGNIILIFIIFLGSVLRLYNLNFDDLWYDEILSFWVASPHHSLLESYEIHNRTEPNTFSYHFILKIIYNFFGYDFNYLRYLSAIFGILSIFLTLIISKLLNFDSVKNFFVFLISLNIFLISYSQEGRVYSILFFFSFLSFIYFVKALDQGEKKKDLFLFFLFTLISIYLHPFAFIILFSYCSFLILKYLFDKISFNKLNYYIIAIFLFSFLFYYFYFISLNHSNSDHYWISNPDFGFYTNFFFSTFFGSRLMGAVFLVTLLTLLIKEKYLFKELNIITVFLITIILAYFLPILFGYIYKPVLISRYIIFIIIPILLLISFLTSKVINKKIRYFLICFLVAITIANHFTEQTFKQFINERVPSKPEYRKAVFHISNSDFQFYFIKVENMISDKDSINAIKNYIISLNEKSKKNLIFINPKLEKIKTPFWYFCPQDINKKECVPNIKNEYEILDEKNFNNINLKLIRFIF